MKKLTLLAASAALGLTAAYAQPGMQNDMHQGQAMPQKSMKQKKQRGMKSLFLIRHGLPHYSMILMKLWDDKGLGLTPEQKSKLEAIRNRTVSGVKELVPQAKELRKKIVQAAKKGTEPAALTPDVEKLASLKARATEIQLQCIYDTKKVLTPEQMAYVDRYIKEKRKKHRKKRHQ
ncbi:hypothetical protein [Hydrogenimonas sp.]